MKIVLAVAVLLLAGAERAGAQPASPSCRTYTRASADAPDEVRGWLAHSADDHVLVCPPLAARGPDEAPAVYSSESTVRRRGAVCSYSRHVLSRVGDGAGARLERDEHGDAVAMTLASGGCPAARAADTANRYTLTYDMSPAAFVSILSFWAAATASPQSFEREVSCCDARAGPDATASRLRAALADGHHLGAAAITRIVRLSGQLWHQRYALTVSDREIRPAGSAVYVIYLGKRPGGTYRISGVSDATS